MKKLIKKIAKDNIGLDKTQKLNFNNGKTIQESAKDIKIARITKEIVEMEKYSDIDSLVKVIAEKDKDSYLMAINALKNLKCIEKLEYFGSEFMHSEIAGSALTAIFNITSEITDPYIKKEALDALKVIAKGANLDENRNLAKKMLETFGIETIE